MSSAIPPLARDASPIIALRFTIQSHVFLTDARIVSRIERAPVITPVPRAHTFVVGLVRLRRTLFALVDLTVYFGQRASPASPLFAIALDGDGIALAADEVHGVVELPAVALHPVTTRGGEALAVASDGAFYAGGRALLDAPRLARLAT